MGFWKRHWGKSPPVAQRKTTDEVFGFKLSEENIAIFENWQQDFEDSILEHQRRVFNEPDRMYPRLDVSRAHYDIKITPVGDQDWLFRLSVIGVSLFPQMEPLIMNDGIEPVTQSKAVTQLMPYKLSLDIAYGDYERLLALGWSVAQMREYEYYLNPTSIGTNSCVRRLGTSEEWIGLTDYNE